MPTRPKINTIYSNHVLQAPDGTPIARISADRSDWYLERGLAREVGRAPFKFSRRWPFIVRNDAPFTIRLNFEPKGRGHAGDAFYLADKENKCVVCGRTDSINRHHVIPRVYRKCMADEHKGRSSHDIVILCTDCHTKYEVEAHKRKRQIAEDLGFVAARRRLKDLPETVVRRNQAKKFTIALLRHGLQIPARRRQEMESVVSEFVDVSDASAMEAFVRQTKLCFPGYLGEDMARHVLARVNLEEFCLGWRRHFVEVMSPRYLPHGWDPERPLR